MRHPAVRQLLAHAPPDLLRHRVEVGVGPDVAQRRREAGDLLAAGCTQILLDNMSNETMTQAVEIARAAGTGASLEASGGLTLERARLVAETGVDFISVGALTHSVTVFDLGLDLREA